MFNKDSAFTDPPDVKEELATMRTTKSLTTNHHPRCAIYQEPPSLRDANDCNCGAIPDLQVTANSQRLLEDVHSRLLALTVYLSGNSEVPPHVIDELEAIDRDIYAELR